MNNRRTFFIIPFFLMTMLACTIPGLSTASNSVPTVETAHLNQMVAETVAAAIALTKEAAPTQAPTSINVTKPGKTPTPASTQESTSTGSSLTPQPDGTTLFVDNLARFQLNVSPGWLPVRIDEQEYYDAFSLPAASQAAVQRSLMGIKTLDPKTFRLFIYDLQDGHMANGVITNVNFVWNPQDSISLDSEADIKSASEALKKSIPNLKVDSYSVSSTTNQIPVGIILSSIPGKTFEGADVVFFEKQMYLNLPAGTLIISFTTEQGFKDATLPFFDTMVESLKINP